MSFEDEARAEPTAPEVCENYPFPCDCSYCENQKAADATKPLVSCRCGVNFDDAAWRHAELVGYAPDGAGGLLEHRNCSCGSTHAIELSWGNARYLEALFVAIEALAKASPGKQITIRSDGAVLYVKVDGRSRVEAVGETLPDAFQACIEATPVVNEQAKFDALFGLVSDREPLQSAERDTRPEGCA